MEIGIYKAMSELRRNENELEDVIKRKENILNTIDRLDPRVKAMKIKEVMVESSRDTTKNNMLDYAIAKEQYAEELIMLDISIDYYQKEIKRLKEFIEKEKKRLNEYDEWEQKVIYMREAKNTWLKIACSVPFSERKCKDIYYQHKRKQNK